jgi:membrane associated rhomboid family serine protease
VCNYGVVPAELTFRLPIGTQIPIAPGLACAIDNDAINRYTPIISVFLHGGWGHILGNAIFLWVFGNNIEDSMGSVRFFFFFELCGLVASEVHIVMSPDSPVPTVGASGAISGVMGAYLVLYPNVRVNMLILPIIFRTFAIRAWIVLIWWFGEQALAAYFTPIDRNVSNGVAVWAHIGGFVSGVILIKVFENRSLVAKRNLIRGERRWIEQEYHRPA